MCEKLVIVGAGGFAKEIYHYLSDIKGVEILGFLDKEKSDFYDLKYLGSEENLDINLIKETKLGFECVLIFTELA